MYNELQYPCTAPAPGESAELAPGVRWIRLPMPYRLNHINVWSLDDGEGWALVDTGLRTDETASAWERVMSEAPLNRPLSRILVTHMHPDHIGMAGWLSRKCSAPLWISRLEYLSFRVLVSDTVRDAPPEALTFYREAGWTESVLHGYRARFGNFGKYVHSLPDSYTRLQDGQSLLIGDHKWEVVSGNGHSPEHACFYCADLKLFISGDQVLPKISSNISVYPMEPDADPVADWYASLDKVQARVPDDVLVLPAHNDCFHGLHARIGQLRDGQDAALNRLREALREGPRRVVDVFVALFRRELTESDAAQFGMATGEAIACLNYLLGRGEILKEVRDGVAWYRAA